MTHRPTVAWVNWSERGESPLPSPEFELVPLREEAVARLAWEHPGAEVLIIDLHPADALVGPDLARVVELCPLPVLVRIPPGRLAEVLPLIRSSDDVCPRDDSPPWLAHRVRRLLSSNDRDPLTQLLNRRAFQKRLAESLREAGRGKPLSVLFVELDHFARINRQYGFAVGDNILAEAASALHGGEILAARLGGDEFALLATGFDELKASLYASELCKRLATHHGAGSLAVTASVGVATAARDGLEPEPFLQDAATAMYSAKAQGRNRAVHFRELEREAVRTGRDVQLLAVEIRQRVVNERAADTIALDSRLALEELQRRADRDARTRLYNRGYLDRRLPLARDDAHLVAQPLCVALFDIDHFGDFNRKHGHPTGDRTLREVAKVIQDNVRAEDWVARYGGEEIAVVLSATLAEAVQVAERVRAAVANHTFTSTAGEPLTVKVSAGVVQEEPGETDEQLWDRASHKVMEAKNAGRNRVVG